jgi:hypothetical protein
LSHEIKRLIFFFLSFLFIREKLGLPSKKKLKQAVTENTRPAAGSGRNSKKCPTPKGQKKLTAFFKSC